MIAFVESWARELAQALEMMTGQPFRFSCPDIADQPLPNALWWAQSLSAAPSAYLAVGAVSEVWNELGTRALLGAGIESVEESEARSTWFEIVQQSISGAVRRLTTPAGQAIECLEGRPVDRPPVGSGYSIALTTPDGVTLQVQLVLSRELLSAVKPSGRVETEPSSAVARVEPPNSPLPLPPASRTMEVLLDVQLPVSISFGSAEMQLRDVFKLSAGSVVELDRQPEEPVDVIVNGCVIARGEVVVVDGNYAVRIQEIMSRKERLDVSRLNRA